MSEALILPLKCVTLIFTALFALPALSTIYTQFLSGKPKDRFYEDADGCGTPKSLAEFSNRKVKTFILFFSILGNGTSIVILVFSSLYQDGWILVNGLNSAAWGLILVHAICIANCHFSVKSHDSGLWLVGSALILVSFSYPQLTQMTTHVHAYKDVAAISWISSIVAAISLAIAASMLPRRPDVFFNSCQVDRQWTVSALNRYTWTWVQPLLHHASVHNDISVDDIPQADSKIRSEDLKKGWDELNPNTTLTLFRSLIAAYKGRVALLWSVTLLKCLVSILPFWAMFRILNILEDGTSRGSHHVELLSFIICMAASNLLDAWIEGWGFWYSLSSLALPIRSQISNLIFDKALRRKVIRAATEDNHDRDSEEEAQSHEVGVLRPRQAIVNLVGVDTERLSYFVQFHFLIINGVAKLLLFSALLLQLLGWIPFAAGIIAWALTLPGNAWFSRRALDQSRSLMKLRDTKLSNINEVLIGMRQIKFSALEPQWEKRILALRETELKTLWKFFLADSGLFACWVISPILLAVASLTTYVLINGSLLPSIAFVSIGIFNALETTLGSLPELFTLGIDSLVSTRRINAYLNETERQSALLHGPTISFEAASISWPVDERAARDGSRFVLHNLHFSFPDGALSVISGKTGTGKTLLISAILGEVDLLQGSIFVPKKQPSQSNGTYTDSWIIPGSVAYISQTPWLESASLRNNIIFGLPFMKARYDNVIEVCALREDLNCLADGDETELGANGINLSGGQKWRITLARAVYSQAEILIMEDIFSAVDAHVGSWIFERCLTGDICKRRTRILVTHHLGLVLPKADFVVELGEGIITYAGRPQAQHQGHMVENVNVTPIVLDSEEESVGTSTDNVESILQSNSLSAGPKKFTQDETRETGSVKRSVYLTYMKSSGGPYLWTACIAIFLAYQSGIIGRAWWLRIWTAETNNYGPNVSLQVLNTYHSLFSPPQSLVGPVTWLAANYDLFSYLKIYIVLSMATAVIGILRIISSYFLAVRASRALFNRMLYTILHTPLRWLDTVPTGRVLNRFTADFNIIDERIAVSWSLFFSNLLRLVGICIASCFASVYLIFPAIILLGLGVVIGRRYLVASRSLKRLESNAKSPVFELFNTVLTGISIIRAFQKTHTYLTQMHKNLDAWAMTTFYIALANRWMSFRMALIAAFFSTAVGVAIVLNPIDAALAGLALSFILDFSESLRWTIRCYGEMELEMNSMERVVEYVSLETEPLSGEKMPAAWPTSGTIEFSEVEVAYAPDLPPVLKGLSFKIEHNERIGVVGRTGAGKSSLTLALCRFLEIRSGTIMIDGIDISKITLSDLRSRLSVIPQDPMLFSGTVRSNLDPFDHYKDDELLKSLARVQLIDSAPTNEPASALTNANIFRDLSSSISESGGNLSQGQRQLLCIARALLTDSKIIVLDEATSAVDVGTDTLIQRSIREGFSDRTLVVIAHRLSTISDFDRILVLDDGCVVEFGTPHELWEKNGTFRSMCDSTGDSEKEKLKKTIVC